MTIDCGHFSYETPLPPTTPIHPTHPSGPKHPNPWISISTFTYTLSQCLVMFKWVRWLVTLSFSVLVGTLEDSAHEFLKWGQMHHHLWSLIGLGLDPATFPLRLVFFNNLRGIKSYVSISIDTKWHKLCTIDTTIHRELCFSAFLPLDSQTDTVALPSVLYFAFRYVRIVTNINILKDSKV